MWFRLNRSFLEEIIQIFFQILSSIQNLKEHRIMILGDYDVDGTTSTAMLYKYFKIMGYDLLYYIPDRYEEGYGVSEKAIEYAEINKVSFVSTISWMIISGNHV